MAGVSGLSGLTGLTPTVTPTVVMDPQEGPDEVYGGPYNPVHGQWEWDNPVPWSIQQGLDLGSQPVPGTPGGLVAGHNMPPVAGAGQAQHAYADPTATFSHNAPWPHVHIPNSGAVNDDVATARQSEANQALHSIDTGDPHAFTTNLQGAPAEKMPWEIYPEYVSSGLAQGTDVGGLTGNNRTGWDRFAGWTAPGDNINRFGFDSAHVTRFTPNDNAQVPVPLDTMQGAQRPMVMNIPGRYGSYPVGQGSPFAGQLPGVGNDTGAAEIGVASDYSPPPDAPTNAPIQQTAGTAAPVWGVTGLGF